MDKIKKKFLLSTSTREHIAKHLRSAAPIKGLFFAKATHDLLCLYIVVALLLFFNCLILIDYRHAQKSLDIVEIGVERMQSSFDQLIVP